MNDIDTKSDSEVLSELFEHAPRLRQKFNDLWMPLNNLVKKAASSKKLVSSVIANAKTQVIPPVPKNKNSRRSGKGSKQRRAERFICKKWGKINLAVTLLVLIDSTLCSLYCYLRQSTSMSDILLIFSEIPLDDDTYEYVRKSIPMADILKVFADIHVD